MNALAEAGQSAEGASMTLAWEPGAGLGLCQVGPGPYL